MFSLHPIKIVQLAYDDKDAAPKFDCSRISNIHSINVIQTTLGRKTKCQLKCSFLYMNREIFGHEFMIFPYGFNFTTFLRVFLNFSVHSIIGNIMLYDPHE